MILNNQFNNNENNVNFATNPLAYNNYYSSTPFVKKVNPLTQVEFNKKDIISFLITALLLFFVSLLVLERFTFLSFPAFW